MQGLLELTDEEKQHLKSYQKKLRLRALDLITPEERLANNKYKASARVNKGKPGLIILWRSSAKTRGIPWGLTDEYLLNLMEVEFCPILELPLIYSSYSGKGSGVSNPCRASLDRIDSDLGYVEGNVRIVSWAFNCMKHTLTDAQVLSYARNIVKNLGDSGDDLLS